MIKERRAHRAIALIAGLLYTMTPAMAQEPPGNSLMGEATEPLKALRQRVKDRRANLSPQERQGWDLLQRMVKADLTVPFIAREIRQNPNGKETELWVRWDPARGARLESIRPAGEIVVDNKTDAFVYNPRKHEWTQRGSLLLGVRRRSGDIARRLMQGTLKATWEGQDTIAVRTADIVRVAPANGAVGPSRRLWIDRVNGLRLKSENVAPDGRVLNSSYYLSLDLAPTFRGDDFTVPQNTTPVEKPNRFRSVAEAAQAGYARLPSVGVHPQCGGGDRCGHAAPAHHAALYQRPEPDIADADATGCDPFRTFTALRPEPGGLPAESARRGARVCLARRQLQLRAAGRSPGRGDEADRRVGPLTLVPSGGRAHLQSDRNDGPAGDSLPIDLRDEQ